MVCYGLIPRTSAGKRLVGGALLAGIGRDVSMI